MLIVLPNGVKRSIYLYAKADYPREFFAFLLGSVSARRAYVNRIFVPSDLKSFSDSVIIRPEWYESAIEQLEDREDIIGDVHSHPQALCCGPSETDIDTAVRMRSVKRNYVLSCIVCVRRLESGRFFSRMRFFLLYNCAPQVLII
ncbi:MAG: Mov34/MPN/PAD-1 family protein [bacterium JZ-2024 1]